MTWTELAKKNFTQTEYDDWEERVAIMEYEGKMTRDRAECKAYADITQTKYTKARNKPSP